ncbi:MAG TPA: hypothetical protein VJ673_07130 [Aromatoleum sp.]|uniref:hypothetical protein n=1 Tax=Aromatoleum sp. TaxID=2307007 RepID=UPI002B470B69|nr:hypothetical protein [Aromatoleum sp.]HJV25441.1 hypothetical protein [Aromatoleum sp.]
MTDLAKRQQGVLSARVSLTAIHMRFLTKFWRLLRYVFLWNLVRVRAIREIQRPWVAKLKRDGHCNVVIFLGPGMDVITGGVMSIVDLAGASRRCLAGADAFVCVCGVPWHPPLARYSKFGNDEVVHDILKIIRASSADATLLIHVPEIYVRLFSYWLALHPDLWHDRSLHVNVLLQNIDLIPNRSDVARLKKYASVSCTAAHTAYANADTGSLIDCEVSHLSVGVCAEKYQSRKRDAKERLILYSPDESENKEFVLRTLKEALPDYRFVEVRNMRYEEYLEGASRAFVSLTFGEGLDSYFVEPIFLGGIGCAVFNERFFTPNYKGLPFVYTSWQELMEKFVDDIRAIEKEHRYRAVHDRQFDRVDGDYSADIYLGRIRDFYAAHLPRRCPDSARSREPAAGGG